MKLSLIANQVFYRWYESKKKHSIRLSSPFCFPYITRSILYTHTLSLSLSLSHSHTHAGMTPSNELSSTSTSITIIIQGLESPATPRIKRAPLLFIRLVFFAGAFRLFLGKGKGKRNGYRKASSSLSWLHHYHHSSDRRRERERGRLWRAVDSLSVSVCLFCRF
jgi:hypothetical protein